MKKHYTLLLVILLGLLGFTASATESQDEQCVIFNLENGSASIYIPGSLTPDGTTPATKVQDLVIGENRLPLTVGKGYVIVAGEGLTMTVKNDATDSDVWVNDAQYGNYGGDYAQVNGWVNGFFTIKTKPAPVKKDSYDVTFYINGGESVELRQYDYTTYPLTVTKETIINGQTKTFPAGQSWPVYPIGDYGFANVIDGDGQDVELMKFSSPYYFMINTTTPPVPSVINVEYDVPAEYVTFNLENGSASIYYPASLDGNGNQLPPEKVQDLVVGENILPIVSGKYYMIVAGEGLTMTVTNNDTEESLMVSDPMYGNYGGFYAYAPAWEIGSFTIKTKPAPIRKDSYDVTFYINGGSVINLTHRDYSGGFPPVIETQTVTNGQTLNFKADDVWDFTAAAGYELVSVTNADGEKQQIITFSEPHYFQLNTYDVPSESYTFEIYSDYFIVDVDNASLVSIVDADNESVTLENGCNRLSPAVAYTVKPTGTKPFKSITLNEENLEATDGVYNLTAEQTVAGNLLSIVAVHPIVYTDVTVNIEGDANVLTASYGDASSASAFTEISGLKTGANTVKIQEGFSIRFATKTGGEIETVTFKGNADAELATVTKDETDGTFLAGPFAQGGEVNVVMGETQVPQINFTLTVNDPSAISVKYYNTKDMLVNIPVTEEVNHLSVPKNENYSFVQMRVGGISAANNIKYIRYRKSANEDWHNAALASNNTYDVYVYFGYDNEVEVEVESQPDIHDFTYTYEGQTLTYTIIDPVAKNCRTKDGTLDAAGNNVSGDLKIPAIAFDGNTEYTVTEIGEYAFYQCHDLTSVEIPTSVTTIGEWAFYCCSGLTSVTIPSSVTTIGNNAFWGCTGLTSVEIPSSVTTIASDVFCGCSGLTSVAIPNSVTTIGDGAFEGCSDLTSVEIPSSVTTIGDYAFVDCSGLTSVVIPASITAIGNNTFTRCTGLTSVVIPGSVTTIGDGAFYGCSDLTSATIPNSVTLIGNYAFYGCSGLTQVTIPNSVTAIGREAFSGCSGLTEIEVDSSNRNYSSVGGVLFNKDQSELIAFPAGKAGDYAIPTSVTTIGEWAFYCCSGLTSVTIPSSVTTIGNNAFWGCTGLTSVEIPSSVTTIDFAAFAYCYGLSSVIIPNSVTTIGGLAFSGCNAIRTVKYMAAEPCEGVYWVFPQEVYDNAVLLVPEVALEKARATDPWCNFQNIQAIAEDVSANFSAAVEALEMGLGDTAMLTLSLGKADEINGFQTDLTLPEGLTIAQNSRGKLNVTLGEGTSLKSHALVAQQVSGTNRYRIMVYSTKLETFVSGEGLLNIPLESDDTFAGGEIIIDSTELVFAADYTEKPGEVRVPVSMLLYGDANDDGRLAVDDIVTEVRYIMENDPQPFSFKKADINRDLAISVADVIKTAELVLNSSAATPAMNTVASAAAPTSREGEAPLTLGQVEFSNGKALLTISLGDVDDLTALQGTLILPEGVSVTDITLADAQVDRDHIIDHVENSATRVSFGVYSLTLDTLEPDAPVLDVELSCTDSFKGGNITLDGIMLVDTKAQGVTYDKMEIAVPDPAIATGIMTVTDGDNAGVDVYNMQGILLMRNATPADIRTLAPGLYIIGGVKELVK